MSSLIHRVNKTKVEPDLLAEMMEMHAGMSAKDRPIFEARAFRMFELLNKRGFRGKRRADLSLAIDFRLTALARLTDAQGGRGFTRPGNEHGMDWIHTDLVRCAAEEPLSEQDDQPTFDIDSFEQRLLAITEMQGEA
jgi:hypothetical protein